MYTQNIPLEYQIAAITNSQGDPTRNDNAGWIARAFEGSPVEGEPFYARHKHKQGIALEKTYADLHGANYALATTWGEGAISMTLGALTKAGDTIISSEAIFGTTKNNLKSMIDDGRNVVFVPLNDMDIWEATIAKHKPKVIFLESPSNPLADLADIKTIYEIAKKYEAKVVVDSTFTPATIYQPLIVGADIVLESATKFIDGHGRGNGGLVAMNDLEVYNTLFNYRNKKGYNQDPMGALYLSETIQTLGDRIRTQSANALIIANALKEMSGINNVGYLGLEEHAKHSLAVRDFVQQADGSTLFGSMISFRVDKTIDPMKYANETNITIHANLGQVDTRIAHPYTSTHSPSRLSEDDIARAGVVRSLMRLSVGIDDPNRVIKKLETGLSAR